MRYKIIGNTEDRKDPETGLWIGTYSLGDGLRGVSRSRSLWDTLTVRVRQFERGYARSGNVRNASYKDVTCEFRDYQEFAEWCQSQQNYLSKEANGNYWGLDKDIIVPFNRVYSPDTCCFVPNEINALLTSRTRDRGTLPLGVTADYGRGNCPVVYRAYCCIDMKRKSLGRRKTPEEAHALWQEAKVKEIRKKVEKYKGRLPDKVLQGLELHASLIEEDRLNGRETIR